MSTNLPATATPFPVIPYVGGRIDAPGIYSGVSMGDYHGPLTVGHSVSRSKLWTFFDQSPAHYFDISPYNENRADDEESEPMLFGRAAHHILLGESSFTGSFSVRPDQWDSWRTKEAKQWRASETLAGRSVLIPSNIDSIRGMASGLLQDPLVRGGILDGLVEHTLVAQDPETGIWIKIRPDAIPTASGDVADLKTTADISDDGIEQALGRDGLVMQGAMTRMVFRLLGLPFTGFTLVFIEKSRPYCVQTKTLTDGDLDLAEEAVRVSLKLFAQCLERSFWPGPSGVGGDASFTMMKQYHRTAMERKIKIMEVSL